MNTKLNKSDWLILGVILGVSTFLNAIDYYRDDNKLIEYLVDFPTSIIITISTILIVIQVLIPKYLIEEKRYVSFFLLAILLLTLLGTLDKVIGLYTGGKTISAISNYWLYFQSGLYNCSDMIGLPLGILLIKKFYEGQQELVLLQKQQKENELKLLRGQLDPHFLFNNLNTLDSLIDSNTEKAKEYINRLSLIYRYLIQTKDAEVMELANEIEFTKNYIFLIQTRFAEDYEFAFEENIALTDKFIPTGAVQTLLENVVKHNKTDGTQPIRTTIKINQGWLIITNTKSNIKSRKESLGTGLKNLKARYKLLSDDKVQIVNTDTKFEVFIPIIELSKA